jgi:hypothetical protein
VDDVSEKNLRSVSDGGRRQFVPKGHLDSHDQITLRIEMFAAASIPMPTEAFQARLAFPGARASLRGDGDYLYPSFLQILTCSQDVPLTR